MTTTTVPVAYRPVEAAAHLGVHVSTIRRLIASGELKAYRVGRCIRVLPEEVDRLRRTSAARDQADLA
jgi:excisionase family DNA binding protein